MEDATHAIRFCLSIYLTRKLEGQVVFAVVVKFHASTSDELVLGALVVVQEWHAEWSFSKLGPPDDRRVLCGKIYLRKARVVVEALRVEGCEKGVGCWKLHRLTEHDVLLASATMVDFQHVGAKTTIGAPNRPNPGDVVPV